jgi:prephenate dehydrogenase
MIVNIVGGRGAMGRVHKPIFESVGHEVIISGRTSSPSLEEAAKQADLTIVSVPISATREIIERVAPHCNGIMDFTGLKEFPIQAMLKYSKPEMEVGGLHPLYGEVDSIEGRSIVYCPTERSEEKCRAVIRCLGLNGGEIITMEPEEHDRAMAVLQNARTCLLETYILLVNGLREQGLSLGRIYEISPKPTQILMDLAARQADTKNDQLYREMREFNPHQEGIDSILFRCLERIILGKEGDVSREIRAFFGGSLESAQERAKKLMENDRKR